MTQPKSALNENQHSDKDGEIHRYQLSSFAAASSCLVTQTSPLTFVVVAGVWAVAVEVAVVVAVAWLCQG